jgi:phenylacetate-coenzyme A ligase PaaK-like adenylate-forming protein
MREADLYFEIVDPATGDRLKDGRYGEVVFTTLTRRGMPLLRYRTGDLARFLPDPCPCGTPLKRLDRVQGRIGTEVELKKGLRLTMQDLDEALFPIDGVLNYTAEVTEAGGDDQIHLCFHAVEGKEHQVLEKVEEKLRKAQSVRHIFNQQALQVGSVTFSGQDWFTTGVKKRKIVDKRS